MHTYLPDYNAIHTRSLLGRWDHTTNIAAAPMLTRISYATFLPFPHSPRSDTHARAQNLICFGAATKLVQTRHHLPDTRGTKRMTKRTDGQIA